MRPITTLRRSLSDPQLMAHVMAGETYRAQRILAMAALGEELTVEERAIFQKFTGGRDYEPGQRVTYFAGISGRRTAKTLSLGMLGTYLTGCCDYGDVLVRGEVGVLLCLAQTQRVATQILNYIEENLKASPVLRQRFVRRTAEAIELVGNLRVESRPASMRNLRGPTYVHIFGDELCFWLLEDFYQNPDTEVLAAARPGLMTTRGMTVLMSSPYSKRGELFNIYRKHFGPQGSPAVLVYKGTTHDLNPTIPEEEIAAELERDPVRNRAEFLAEFRTDIENLVPLENVEAVVSDYIELPPSRDFTYVIFVDAAGGSGECSFACAVAHRDGDQIIVDGAWEWVPPFLPGQAIAEIAAIARRYSIGKIVGDHWADGFTAEGFQKHSLAFEATKRVKNSLYADMVPLINSRRITLPRNAKMIGQIAGLEQQVGRSGRDSIGPPPGGRDDIANCVAGAASLVFGRRSFFGPDSRWLDDDDGRTPEQSGPDNPGQSYAELMANGGTTAMTHEQWLKKFR